MTQLTAPMGLRVEVSNVAAALEDLDAVEDGSQRTLVDVDILIYAVDETSRFHDRAVRWLEQALNRTRRVGLPGQSLTAFVRFATHPGAQDAPLSPSHAWDLVGGWL